MYEIDLSFTEQVTAYVAAAASLGADERSDDARQRALAAYLRLVLVHGSDPAEPFACLVARELLIDTIIDAGGDPRSFRVHEREVRGILEQFGDAWITALELCGADQEDDPRWWSTGKGADTVVLVQ